MKSIDKRVFINFRVKYAVFLNFRDKNAVFTSFRDKNSTDLFELSKDGNIIPKKRVNCDKCDFATKQRMFGVFAIDEILRYRGI